jgi:PAS domain S-box-containing protein
VTQDLSERRVAEEESRRFRLLVDSVKDYAIFILDPDGRIATWNAGAERLKGYTRQEILGRHFSTFYTRDDIDAAKCELELEGAARDGRFEDEGWRLRKDGSRFWANVVITALRDQAGALVGYAKVTRDLTDRLRVEQERTHALAMEEAARRKDEFLAVMGHELRNPLASIVTAAHLMKLRGGRANEKEVDVVDRQARHMTRLVDDLLDASRALRDKVVLFPKKVEIGVVLANAIELASALFEHRRHGLTVDVPEGLVVQVDVERMGQVFGNILSNAAKYTPEGGRIHMSAEAVDDHVLVRIEDNGRGIAPELLAQVFDLFVQGEQGIERKEGGLGIGLAVARKFVEAHGGEIRAESAGTGRGTRFTVRLPFSHAASPDVAVEEQPAPSKKRRRILLVDDNHDSVDLMRALLEYLGHEAHVAYDGPTGVQAFRELQPDIVLLDIGLPGLSGYEVLAQMRAMPAGAKAAIIAVSGYARDVDRARALKAGFTDHLGKPVQMRQLVDLLAIGVAPE